MATVRMVWAVLAVLGVAAQARAQAAPPTRFEPEVRTFELTAVPPPTPALKYQLLYADLVDRRPGNAAILYLDAILLMGPDDPKRAARALDAHRAGDAAAFAALADTLELPAVFAELDLAARREQCEWDAPFREMGGRTLLPHLDRLRNGLGALVQVRALRQIERGDAEGALRTLRLGYAMADKVAREWFRISGTAAMGITEMNNEALARLMSRPESPNLYWALLDLPERRPLLRETLGRGRMWSADRFQTVARVKAKEALSATQWRSVFDYVLRLHELETGRPYTVDPVRDASREVLRRAREAYARSHQVDAAHAAGVDPAVVLGEHYFAGYEVLLDDNDKLRGLPYPLLIARTEQFARRVQELRRQQPSNVFLLSLPLVGRAVWAFARVDRQLAALTAVEAVRSYAAAHGGALPARLEDIAETPPPVNPMSGKPFDYRVEGRSAVLSDPRPESPLTYTITIRR